MTTPRTLQVSCAQLHWAQSLERNLQKTLRYIRAAEEEGSRVVLFPEANLTSYYFPFVIRLSPAEAGYYQEEMITAVLDLGRADRSTVRDSLDTPPFLRRYWQPMIRELKRRANRKPV